MGLSVGLSIICEKCGQIAYSKVKQTRRGKYGQIYQYFRFVHYLGARKTTGAIRPMNKRFRYCYVPIIEEPKITEVKNL